jgi:putative transposon-encoded protein
MAKKGGVHMTEEKPMGRPRKNPVQVDENGQEYVEAVAMAQSNTGRVYVPAEWVGHRVRVTRID